jgi:hypothetical protein
MTPWRDVRPTDFDPEEDWWLDPWEDQSWRRALLVIALGLLALWLVFGKWGTPLTFPTFPNPSFHKDLRADERRTITDREQALEEARLIVLRTKPTVAYGIDIPWTWIEESIVDALLEWKAQGVEWYDHRPRSTTGPCDCRACMPDLCNDRAAELRAHKHVAGEAV